MIHSEKRVRTVTEEITVAATCDLCKCRFDKARASHGRVNWSTDPMTPQETIVEYRELINSVWYSTTKSVISCHICPDCFIKRLVPWLKEQAAESITCEYNI